MPPPAAPASRSPRSLSIVCNRIRHGRPPAAGWYPNCSPSFWPGFRPIGRRGVDRLTPVWCNRQDGPPRGSVHQRGSTANLGSRPCTESVWIRRCCGGSLQNLCPTPLGATRHGRAAGKPSERSRAPARRAAPAACLRLLSWGALPAPRSPRMSGVVLSPPPRHSTLGSRR